MLSILIRTFMVADCTLGLGMWNCFVKASCSHIRSRNSVQALLKTHEEADLVFSIQGMKVSERSFCRARRNKVCDKGSRGNCEEQPGVKVAWWLFSWQSPEYFGRGAVSHCCPSSSLHGRHALHVGRSPWEADKISD